MSKFISPVARVKLIRDRGSKCQCCGYSEHPAILELHHLVSQSEGGSDKEDNLYVLCPNCHKIFHTPDYEDTIMEMLDKARKLSWERNKRWIKTHKNQYDDYHRKSAKAAYRRKL